VKTLNEAFSTLSMRRRYEVWFLRVGLADGSGACWLRYLLMNPGRGGCPGNPSGMPVQVWATWFPRDGKPQSYIQGFPLTDFSLSNKGQSPFRFAVGANLIDEHSCRGQLQVDGHAISWDLRYHSSFRVTVSGMGWIGFSRSPHADAVFSGWIKLDGQTFQGDPLGFGVQGHNCGYRHRNFWTWAHAYFPSASGPASTFEALVYEMPFGLRFRKAVLWHGGREYVFRNLREDIRDSQPLKWSFKCSGRDGQVAQFAISGSSPSIHRLPYVRTDCSRTFQVSNNSRSTATLLLRGLDRQEELSTEAGAVLEMVGD
jgi:hypothetical protein